MLPAEAILRDLLIILLVIASKVPLLQCLLIYVIKI